MKKALLYASTFIIEDDLMWFVPTRYNYLCCYNLATEKVEKKFRLPEKNLYPRMYDNILSHEGKLYLIPFNGRDILVFDKETKEFKVISLAPYNTIDVKFCAATIYEDKLYLFPEFVEIKFENSYIIVKVDLNGESNLQIITLDVPVLSTEDLFNKAFDRNVFVIENRIYILLQSTNKILEYNLRENRWKIFEVGDNEKQYVTMQMKKDNFYLIDQDGEVSVWNKSKNVLAKYTNSIQGYSVEHKTLATAFSASAEYNDNIYFIPRDANRVIAFDGEVVFEPFFQNVVLECDKKLDSLWAHGCFAHVVLTQEKLYLWNHFNHKLHIINLDDRVCESMTIETSFDDDELMLFHAEFEESQINGYIENMSIYSNLDFYLQRLLLTENVEEETNQIESIGETIIKKVMG